MSDAVVQVRDLRHAYGERVALDGVSFDVAAARSSASWAPTAAARRRSSAPSAPCLPAPPDRAVSILGLDPVATATACGGASAWCSSRRASTSNGVTAEENLLHHGHLYGLRGDDLRRRAAESLAAFGLADRARERIDAFSGGMRRRRARQGPAPPPGGPPARRAEHRPRPRRPDRAVASTPQPISPPAASPCSSPRTSWRRPTSARALGIMRARKTARLRHPRRVEGAHRRRRHHRHHDRPGPRPRRARRAARRVRQFLDGAVRLERPRGHEFVPQLIEAVPGLVDAVSVGKPTLQDVFIRLTGERLNVEPAAPPPPTARQISLRWRGSMRDAPGLD